MEKLEDTQNERDSRDVAIQRVGIRELRHPIIFLDCENDKQATVATAAMAVALSPELRGTHMSRFVAILSEVAESVSLAQLPAILETMLERLEASEATFELQFPYFITKAAPITKSSGKLDYQVTLKAERLAEGREAIALSVRVPVTTLCPCSRNIAARGAHNQRGEVLVTVTGKAPDLPSIPTLIRAVEASGSSELYSVLKRPDEKQVTERAYDHPVFVEDLVRNVAVKLRAMNGIDTFRIEGENFESIHNHNAFAVVVEG